MKKFAILLLVLAFDFTITHTVHAQITPGDPGNFITIWQTDIDNSAGTSDPDQITIPTTGSGYNYNIYWENVDDSSDNGTLTGQTGSATITFPKGTGTYRIEINGSFPRIYFNSSGDRRKILSVEQWGNIQWTSMEWAFFGAQNLIINANDAPDLGNVTSMRFMFRNASSLNSDLNHWDVSGITDMEGVFNGASSFNGDISDWKVSNVTNMRAMFSGASSFNRDITGWDVSNVEIMTLMFSGASGFNQNIGYDSNTGVGWDVSNVTRMDYMFSGASSFNGDISGWQTASLTSFFFMFQNATNFNADIGGWDVSGVSGTRMTGLFLNAAAFNQDLTDWDVSNVTSMSSVFQGASSFNGDISGWDTGNVQSMNGMFRGANSFNRDLYMWDVSSVTNMSAMFQNNAIFNGNVGYDPDTGEGWDVSNVTNMGSMFNNAAAFNGDISGWDTGSVSTMFSMFSGAASFNADIGNWNVSKVQNMGFLFSGASSINQDLSSWDISQVTEVRGMFTNASSFDQNLGTWNIEHITSMSGTLTNAGLSTENYDATLTGWSQQNVNSGVTLTSSGLTYCAAVERDNLLTAGWTIIGDSPGICAQVVDAGNSDADATSPHIADGADASTVTIKLADQADQPVSGLLNTDFLIELTGSASASVVIETEFEGVYTFSVTNTVEESVTLTITAGGTELTQKPVILFEDDASPPPPPPVVVSADNSSVTATSPHLADGLDASTIEIVLRDESNQPIPGFTNDDFSIGLEGIGEATNAESTDVTETSTPGTYRFQVTNVSEDNVVVYVRADFVDLSDTPVIVFEEPAEHSTAFITTWRTNPTMFPPPGASADNQIRIPMIGNGYNFTVHWGDGTSETYTANPGEDEFHYLEHTYPSVGDYQVSITGDFPRIYSSGSGDSGKILSVDQWGDIQWASMAYAFAGASRLASLPETDAPDLSNVESMERMFLFTRINPDLTHWDVSNVRNMRGLFEDATFFNGDISNWNVSNVTDMSYMFQDAVQFNGDIQTKEVNVETPDFYIAWDVSNVVTMANMFAAQEGNAFNADISAWDVSSVEDMSSMFDKATSFNQDISGWDVSSVTNMEVMFFGARAFNADISGWNTASLNSMFSMFEGAESFNQSLGSWDVSRVPDMSGLFNFSNLSSENYDNTLIGWAAQNLESNVTLGAFGRTYCAEDARNRLISDFDWEIEGDALAGDCGSSQLVDAVNSDANATSPHFADGADASTVTIKLADQTDEPIGGLLNSDFLIGLTGSAVASDVTETATPGEYAFTITNTVAESVTVTITADGVQLTQQPVILFEEYTSPPPPPPVVVSADNSSVTATSPHLANGIDASTVTIVLRDESNQPISGFTNDDFSIGLEGLGEATNAQSTDVIETSTPGTYRFQVTNVSEDNVIVYVRADFFDLSDTPVIVFEEPAEAAIAFITTWKTDNTGPSADNQIRIPLYGEGYNITVDWGDGSSGTYSPEPSIIDQRHYLEYTYSEPGTYTISISGDFPRIYFNQGGDREKILAIEQWGDIQWRSMEMAFAGASNLAVNASDAPNLSNVTSLRRMFLGASSLDSDLNHWNVSTITSMEEMFWNAGLFNGNISDWNVSLVQSMAQMFRGASSFNGDISGWDVSSVTNMGGMFLNATSFNGDIRGWITGNVLNMNSMFRGASSFNGDISGWNTGNVTTMASMFLGAEAFNADIGGWNVSSVTGTGMESMFNGASSFNQDLSDWDVSNVTRMRSMFEFAVSFNGDISGWDTGNVDNMNSMFRGASSFNGDISGWDVSKVTNMGSMFAGATMFDQDIRNWDVSNVTLMSSMFSTATSFNQNLNYNPDTEEGWNTGKVVNMSSMFQSASSFNGDLSGWDVSSATNMSGMFALATSFNSNISEWDVSKVTNMSRMFDGAAAFNQPVGSSWNVLNASNMSRMFLNAAAFDQPLGDWNIDNVTTMSFMLANTGISRQNYDATLIGWSGKNPRENVALGAAGRTYCAVDARNILTDTYNWNITGDEPAEDCTEPVQLVDASNSSVSATSPHIADGVDTSIATVIVRDEDDEPITLLVNDDFLIELTGSAIASDVEETGTPGTYSFTITNTEIETVTLKVTVQGVELDDQPDIEFEAAEQIVDAEKSSVTASSPHLAGGVDQSVVTIVLVDTDEQPISGYTNADFTISLTGSAQASEVTESETEGTYTFTVTNNEAEVITVTVIANGTELNDKPEIDFETPPQIVDASNSSVSATSPHIADGVDTSIATVIVRDEDDEPITLLVNDDFLIELTGSAIASDVEETGTPGTYSFTITNTEIETVTLKVIVKGVELDDQPDIEFEAAEQIVDAGNSSVSATSPHIADGVDTSIATVIVRDEDDEPITLLVNDDFLIELTGSAIASDVEETGTPGTYSFTITNTEIETVTLKVTVQGVELDDQPEIEFEAAVQIVDAAASSTSSTSPHFSDGVDASVVTIVVIDTEGDPISGIDPEEFVLNHSGVGLLSGISETDAPGTYTFTVTSDTPGSASVKIGVRGVALEDVSTVFIKPVDSGESIVSASTPHIADGEDAATVTIVVVNDEREPFIGLENDDFLIELTGSAVASTVSERGSRGEYTVSVTNTVAEMVIVSITVLGVQLDDQPEIIFEEPIQIPDADNSSVTASSPQIIDDIKISTVTVILRDESAQPIPGRTADDFDIEVTGSAVITSIGETDTPGTYRFTVTNTEEEIITVSVTADGIELNDKPDIDFVSPPQVPDAERSSITATTPHIADGEDASTVLITLVDGDDVAISGFVNDDFAIDLTGSATASSVSETEDAGVYSFTITNSVAEIVTIVLTAGGVEINNQTEVEFEAPPQVVDAENSSVSATSPHLADGEDLSVVTILLRDQNDEPISGFENTDFTITLSGSAVASGVSETETEGTYQFTVTNEIAEIVTVTVTADDVELADKPEIDFESPPQVVDAQLSFTSATTPHIANGLDASEVSVILRDENDTVISGLVSDNFEITLSSNAIATSVTETDKPGTYLFNVTSTEAGIVSVVVAAKGVTINKKAFIEFEEPEIVVDINGSSVSATSPHLADGEDFSTITIKLLDEKGDPITGLLAEDFSFDLPEEITASVISESNTPGTYELTIISTRPGIIDLKFIVLGAPLAQTAVIEFIEPDPVVDAFNSEVAATSPHLADGEDASTVSITLKDEENELITGVNPNEFSIHINGIATASEPNESDTGLYRFTVVSEFVGSVSIHITVLGTDLNDIALIEFKSPPIPVPDPPVINDLTGDASEVKITWQAMNLDFIQNFIIYRGESPDNLEQIGQATANAISFVDGAPSGSTLFYRLSAVNTDGLEGGLSEVVTFLNSSITADQNEWKLVSSPLVTPLTSQENITLFGFINQYEISDEMKPAAGYWIKSRTFDMEAIPVKGSGLTSSTYNLQKGWNLIGSLSAPASVSNIVDESGILTQAPVFGFSPTGYTAVQTLLPNNGYWIYASGEGAINLKMDEQTEQNKKVALEKVDFSNEKKSWIEFQQAGQKRKLWMSDFPVLDEEKISYILPPMPPGNLLDVRTAGSLILVDSHSDRIQIRSKGFPVSVSLHGLDDNSEYTWRFKLSYGINEHTIDLLPGRPIQLLREYDRIEVMRIRMDEAITENRLMPNYPNPFNPATTINYQVRDNEHVRIEVFDSIGRRVQVLTNEIHTSGEYKVNFDATHLSTGMYIVRFIAGGDSQIRKITLIK